jgi:hypothetical protein
MGTEAPPGDLSRSYYGHPRSDRRGAQRRSHSRHPHIPGVIAAGTFYDMGEKVFWAVHDPERAIAIDLHDEDYSMLILEVADPDATIYDIRRAIAHTNV